MVAGDQLHKVIARWAESSSWTGGALEKESEKVLIAEIRQAINGPLPARELWTGISMLQDDTRACRTAS